MITEESFVDFKCPYCGDTVSFPRDCVGFAQACPNCTESVIVPEDGSEMGFRPPIPMTTPRLVLRRLQAGDWKDLLECLADEELFRYTEGHPLEEAEMIHWLESDSHVKLTTPGQAFYLGMEVQDGGKLVGYLSLILTDPQRLHAAINILVGRNHQRKGLATEAMAALFDFCFRGIKLHRVTASCDSRNVAACRLVEKAGMRREGVFLKDHFADGEWFDTVSYAVLNEDFAKEDGSPPKSAAT